MWGFEYYCMLRLPTQNIETVTCTHIHWMSEHCRCTVTFHLKGDPAGRIVPVLLPWSPLFPPLQRCDIVWSWWMSASVLFIKRLGSSNGYLNDWGYLASAFLCLRCCWGKNNCFIIFDLLQHVSVNTVFCSVWLGSECHQARMVWDLKMHITKANYATVLFWLF